MSPKSPSPPGPLRRVGAAPERRSETLQRDRSAGGLVHDRVDRAHPAACELALDAVAPRNAARAAVSSRSALGHAAILPLDRSLGGPAGSKVCGCGDNPKKPNDFRLRALVSFARYLTEELFDPFQGVRAFVVLEAQLGHPLEVQGRAETLAEPPRHAPERDERALSLLRILPADQEAPLDERDAEIIREIDPRDDERRDERVRHFPRDELRDAPADRRRDALGSKPLFSGAHEDESSSSNDSIPWASDSPPRPKERISVRTSASTASERPRATLTVCASDSSHARDSRATTRDAERRYLPALHVPDFGDGHFEVARASSP